MSKLPAVEASGDVLVRLANAHDAMHREIQSHEVAQDKALADVWQRHAPFVMESKSVFLQVQAEAYRAGFTDDDMRKVLSSHAD